MPAIHLMTVADTEPAAGVETQTPKSLKLQGIKNAFSNYMQQNSSNTAQAAAQQNAAPQQAAKTQQADAGVQQQYEQYQSRSAAQADRVSSASDAQGAESGAVNEAADGAAEEIKDSLKENLGVTDEQIQAAMELLGLTQADLLDPAQLTALAVELTGSEDAGMMLFSEGFQNVMQDVQAVTAQLLDDLGMTMEQLKEQIAVSQAETVDTAQAAAVQPQQAEGQEPAQEAAAVQPQEEQAAQPQQEAGTEAWIPVQQQEAPQAAAQGAQAAAAQAQPQEEQAAQEAAAVQPQEEQAAPQAAAQAQPQEEQQTPQQEQQTDAAPENGWNAKDRAFETEENTRFDFAAEVRQPAAEVNAPLPQSTAAQAPAAQIDIQNVMEQIVEFTKVHLSEEVRSIEMQLNPENLGRVYLHVSEKQGTVTAQLTAQNENIKEALVQQAAILKENLNQQGIKVDAVEVSVGTHEFESNLEKDARGQEERARQQEEQGSRRSRRSINLNDLDSLDGLSGLMTEEELLAAQIMRDNGNNVDYKA